MTHAGTLCTLGALLLATAAAAEPNVANPSFEADRFATWPGCARHNGGKITGWTFRGSVGINPTQPDPAKPKAPRHAFTDNGLIPHGRQVAFLQNACTLSQAIGGFEKGKRYRVTYRENARHNNAPKRNPRLKATLGGETIVSEHAVEPVEPVNSRTLPYHLVESAVFTAPRTGAFTLVFTTTFADRVAALIDHVRIVELK